MLKANPNITHGLIAILVLVGAGYGIFRTHLMRQPLPSVPTNTPASSSEPSTISGIVVPHHDLVKDRREALFATLKPRLKRVKTVILVSPNHYSTGRYDIETTDTEWKVDGGTIQPNQEVITALLAANAHKEPDAFANEHGIKLLLGDIKNTFPEANIVPVIFKMNTREKDIEQLHGALLENCHDCLMVASVDFSHYQPALLAELHDSVSIRLLQNRDASGLLTKSEVDSPPALALLTKWAESHGTKKFVLHDHTNSGILAKNNDIETTTHVFGWYESGASVEPEKSVSFIMGGDMMFGRMIAHTFLKGGLEKSLDQLGERIFWGTDASIVNLEGPVSDIPVPDDTRPNNLLFNFPPESMKALQFLRVQSVSLANNHSYNKGEKGLTTTRTLLEKGGIQWLGGPHDADTAHNVTFNGEGINIVMIGVHALASQPDITPEIRQIKADSSNRVIIFPHWGAEYIYSPTSTQKQLAHQWIDAGADVVIGAHPHVIESSEVYKGHPVIYSMGNLLFDQTFSTETQQGLLVAGDFTEKSLRLFALPVQTKQYKPSLMRGENKKAILEKLYQPFAGQIKTGEAGTIVEFTF